MKQTELRTKQILDGLDDTRMVDDLVDPREQQVRLEVVAAGELLALGRLERLHGAPIAQRLLGAERVDRIDEAVAVVALDLRLGQLLAHARPRFLGFLHHVDLRQHVDVDISVDH
jgi:hypothetical protein